MKMRSKFQDSPNKYLDYYIEQAGSGGGNIFVGRKGQRGHGGLGGLLSGLFRSALPMLKRGLATFGKHALKTGIEMAHDVAEGTSVKDSAKKRVPDAIKRFALQQLNQTGSGLKRRGRRRQASGKRIKNKSRKRKISRNKSVFKKRRLNDIFG